MGAMSLALSAVQTTTRVAVERHFADSQRTKGSRGIYYVGKVLSGAPLADAWRDQFPATVVTWQNRKRVDISVAELLALDDVVIPAWTIPYSDKPRPQLKRHPREIALDVPIVSWSDTPRFCDDRVLERIDSMNLIGVETIEDLWLLHFSTVQCSPGFYRAHQESRAWVVPIDLKGVAALRCEFLGSAGSYFHLLNQHHEMIEWLCRLREYSRKNPSIVKCEHVEAAWKTASTAWYSMRDLVLRWADSKTIPDDLKPPRNRDGVLLAFGNAELYSRATLPLDSK